MLWQAQWFVFLLRIKEISKLDELTRLNRQLAKESQFYIAQKIKDFKALIVTKRKSFQVMFTYFN